MKAPTLFSTILIVLIAGACTDLARDVYAQARDPGRARVTPPAAISTLSGRIVYADTGNPVRRAEVTLVSAVTGERLGEVVTGVKGEFSFKEIPAGRYFLTAAAPSLVSTFALSPSGDAADVLDLADEQESFTEVEVNGTNNADVIVRARRGGAITGRVVSEDSEPVAGAELRFFRLRGGRPAPMASTRLMLESDRRYLTTDSRGFYRLAGLPPGDYLVRASESDLGRWGEDEGEGVYGDGSLVVSYYPSSPSVKDASEVKVYKGRDTDGVDIVLPSRPVHKLSGVVFLKRDGRPVIPADIRITRKDEGEFPHRGFLKESATTDENGRWEVRGVPDGEYILAVSSFTSITRGGPEGARPEWILPAKRTVTVSGADVSDIRIAVDVGGHIAGTASVEGGKPLPELLQIQALKDGEEVDYKFVRDGGVFSLDDVPAGAIRLRVSGFPVNQFYVKSLTWKGTDLSREPLRLGEGAVVEGVRVVLSSEVATLRGEALSRRDGGAPLSRAVVVLVPADAALRRSGALRFVRADPRGKFEFVGAPGEYLAFVLPEQYALKGPVRIDEGYLSHYNSRLTRVTLRAGEAAAGVKVFAVGE